MVTVQCCNLSTDTVNKRRVFSGNSYEAPDYITFVRYNSPHIYMYTRVFKSTHNDTGEKHSCVFLAEVLKAFRAMNETARSDKAKVQQFVDTYFEGPENEFEPWNLTDYTDK